MTITGFKTFLGEEIDNSALVLFRICFGFLAAAESFGAIATGWVKRAFITPEYTFPFIGFEWLQPLPGGGMYIYFAVMGIFGVLMMIGLFYRYATLSFLFMWLSVYLMQKTNYNNHYFFLVLLSAIMSITPANRSVSLDVRFGFVDEKSTIQRLYIFLLIAQVLIVYLYASLNKIYPDWLNARPIHIWFDWKSGYPLIGSLLAQEWFQYAVSYGGIVYDGTIVFMLLNRKTRKLGFVLSILFNLFNSAVFQIGIFPYMMIALSALFFPGESIRNIFFKHKPIAGNKVGSIFNWQLTLLLVYLVLQILIPSRHRLFEGDVNWTEEGHRMSWRMMLRQKSGWATFRVIDKKTGVEEIVRPAKYLTSKQSSRVSTLPDMTWQFAQILKQIYAQHGKDVRVFVDCRVSLNGSDKYYVIDKSIDLASVPWERFKHSSWIISPEIDD